MTFSRLPLKRLGNIFLGKMLQSEAKMNSDVEAPYLRAAHIQPDGRLIEVDDKTMWFGATELQQHDLLADDVVVVEGGAGYGRSAVVQADRAGWGFQNSIVRVRPKRGTATGRYLNYAIQSALTSGEIEVACFTATIPHFTADKVGAFRVPAPDLPQQYAIADYLDRETARIDTLIEEQQRLIEMQVERRHAVIDLGVFGLLRGRSNTRESSAIGRHKAVEPLLSRIPPDWNVVRFKVALVRCDERNVDLSQPMMSLKSSGAVVPRDNRQQPSEDSLPRYFVVRPDDLVVNPMWLVGGAIGVSATFGAVSPDYRVFRSAGHHSPRYLHHVLRSRPYLDQYVLYTRANTTFDRRVQQLDLDNLPLPVPPISMQISIAKQIDEQTTKIDTLITESKKLIELARERRAALITAAVTGQIDVREVA